MSLLNYDEDGNLIVPFAGQKTKTWSESQKERINEAEKQKWKALNEKTKPWTNSYKKYTNKKFRIIMEGNSNDEEDLIKIGKQFGRKATELRLLRNRYLDTKQIPQCFWGQSISGGKHDLPNKPDHQGKQLKKIIDERPDYYRGFT